jgi:hypothetical protein
MAGDKVPRAQSSELIEQRHARNLVAPYQRRAAQWNEQLARLRVVSAIGRDDLSAEARGVVPLIVAARVQLQEAAASEPEMVRSHGVVRDMDRALYRLVLAFEGLAGTTNPRDREVRG